MKKQIIAVIGIITITVMLFVGCTQKNDDVDATVNTEASSITAEADASTTAETESAAAEESSSEESTASDNKKENTGASTTAAKNTTAKAAARTTTKATTKATTQATTKATTKATTTTQKASYCTNNNNHSASCGNMGRWFNSRNEVDNYWSSICDDLGNKYENGQITWEEYAEKCPYGYETYACNYCGKWTGNFRYR